MEQDRLQPDYCPTCRSTTQYEMIKILETCPGNPGRRIEHRRCDRCHNDYRIDVLLPVTPIDFRGLRNE